jgi:hypothetical protein
MYGSAMAPERRTDRAHARAACTLLPPEFSACSAHFTLILGLVRPRAQPAQIPPRSFVQQMLVHLRAKDRIRQFHLANFLAIQIDYIHDRHVFLFQPQTVLGLEAARLSPSLRSG